MSLWYTSQHVFHNKALVLYFRVTDSVNLQLSQPGKNLHRTSSVARQAMHKQSHPVIQTFEAMHNSDSLESYQFYCKVSKRSFTIPASVELGSACNGKPLKVFSYQTATNSFFTG